MRIVGLMTGTSLDGIDAALVEVSGAGRALTLETLAFETTPYPPGLAERIAAVLAAGEAPLAELAELHGALGKAYAGAVRHVASAAGLPLEALDAVGCHGQTFWHAPAGAVPVSLQLGEAAWIAEETGLTVVSDFRPADVAAGGQGAPLVPYLDALLFERLGPGTVALNLGGIANVTALGEGGLLAFDTGPGMALLDQAARLASGGALPYDADGRLSAAGRPCEAAVEAWLAEEPYFAAPPPKSTGRELFGAARFEALARDAEARFGLALGSPDGVATLALLTARAVALGLGRFAPGPVRRVVVSGGGARHPGVLAALGTCLPEAAIASSAAHGVDPDAKEAVAFALFARQALFGEANVAPGATGATRAVVAGKISPGRNFARVLLKARAPEPLATERVHPDALAARWDAQPLAVGARLFQQADAEALASLEGLEEGIAGLAGRIAGAFASGGRLLYVGAGTSGRLGVLDASECPPTFSVPAEWVQGLIAGGEPALTRAVEGAEDDAEAGAKALEALGVGPADMVVGLSANGRAPYVWGALGRAREAGAGTALVCCNAFAALGAPFRPDHVLEAPVGPELLAGSSRLKAGTATKLVLNRLSTLAMVASGRCWGPYMVDVAPTNRKLRGRAADLVAKLGRVSPERARELLETSAWRVKPAIVMARLGLELQGAEALLQRDEGRLNRSLGAP